MVGKVRTTTMKKVLKVTSHKTFTVPMLYVAKTLKQSSISAVPTRGDYRRDYWIILSKQNQMNV